MTVWLPKDRRTYRYCFLWRGQKYVGGTGAESRREADQVEAAIRRRVMSKPGGRYPQRIRRQMSQFPVDADGWIVQFNPAEYAQLVFDQVRAEAARRQPDQVLYFIGPAKPNTVKIGLATDVKRRLRSIQTGSSTELQVLALVPGSRRIERYLHWAFADAAMTGEWFRRTEEMEMLIDLFQQHSSLKNYSGAQAFCTPEKETKAT